ncbi:hypothetical protein [Haloarcula sp. H-GB5]
MTATILVILTVLGLGLRGYMVDQYFLQVDEANRLGLAMLDVPFLPWLHFDMTVRMQKRAHSSLFLILTRGFVASGASPVLAIRLPSVILGTLTVPATYVMWRRVSRRVAMIAAGLIAVLPYHVFYSRTGWHVSAMTFCLVMSLACLERGYFTQDDSKIERLQSFGYIPARSDIYLFFAGMWVFAGYLFHETIIAMLAPATLFILWDQYPDWDSRLGVIICSLLPMLAYYVIWPLHTILGRQNSDQFATESGINQFLLSKLTQMVNNLSQLFNLASGDSVVADQSLLAYLTVPVVVFAVIGIWAVYRHGRPFERFLAVLILLYPPVISFLHFGAQKPRFYVVTIPIFAILAAQGIVALSEQTPRLKMPLAAGALSSALILILAIMTVSSLFMPVSGMPQTEDISDRYQSRAGGGEEMKQFVVQNMNQTGDTKIAILGGGQPQYHLWEYRSEVQYVGLSRNPQIALVQPWTINQTQETKLQECYTHSVSVHAWEGYIRTSCTTDTSHS